jgi:hypothetical protein
MNKLFFIAFLLFFFFPSCREGVILEDWTCQYAFAVPVHFSLEDSGVWQTLPDGSKVWRLEVSMPGARSIDACYDKFWLPDSALFLVYSEDPKQCLAPVTSRSVLKGSREEPTPYASAIICGDHIVFEYRQPACVKESAVISISRLNYGYKWKGTYYVEVYDGVNPAPEVHIITVNRHAAGYERIYFQKH